MKILDNGIWDDEKPDDHFFDEKLSKSILSFLKLENTKTLVDMGCGDGKYTKFFNENGIKNLMFDYGKNEEYNILKNINLISFYLKILLEMAILLQELFKKYINKPVKGQK